MHILVSLQASVPKDQMIGRFMQYRKLVSFLISSSPFHNCVIATFLNKAHLIPCGLHLNYIED